MIEEKVFITIEELIENKQFKEVAELIIKYKIDITKYNLHEVHRETIKLIKNQR